MQSRSPTTYNRSFHFFTLFGAWAWPFGSYLRSNVQATWRDHLLGLLPLDLIRRIKNVRTVLLSNMLHGLERLIVAGVTAAGGVCIMHYLGMQAMVFDGVIEWNGGIVAASVIIAIVTSP